MSIAKDLSGNTYGRWSVLNRVSNKGANLYWKVRCSCGNIKEVAGSALTSGKSLSCGCYKNELQSIRLLKHGDSGNGKERLYGIWATMKQRCNNPNTEYYYMYGGIGIKVCLEWNSYEKFKEWALTKGYANTLTIDRKNETDDYCPSNCRWVSITEQAQNKKRYKNNSSGYTGVSFHRNTQKWRALINVNSKPISLGLFNTPLEASKARDIYIDNNPKILHRKHDV